MSRGATLSVLGLYNFDSSLFDEMAYPSGFTNEEKQTVVGNILMECAELEFLFPDFDAAKQAIGIWSHLNVAVWERIFTAANLEYNPIENYNRTELETISDDQTDTHSGNDVTRTTGTDSRTLSSTGSETNSGTDTETNKISAYDSGNLVDHDQSLVQHGHGVSSTSSGSDSTVHGHVITDNSSSTDSTTYGKTDTLTHGEQIVHEGDVTKNSHISGNIGVTTSQQMLEQEIEISAKLNVMDMIVRAFKERFCILVY